RGPREDLRGVRRAPRGRLPRRGAAMTRVVVTGGSRGLGLGIVEALVDRGDQVTVVARDRARLAEVARRLGVATVAGDVVDQALAATVLREVRPEGLILNAGAAPAMAPIHEQTLGACGVV